MGRERAPTTLLARLPLIQRRETAAPPPPPPPRSTSLPRPHSPALRSLRFLSTDRITSTLPTMSTTMVTMSTAAREWRASWWKRHPGQLALPSSIAAPPAGSRRGARGESPPRDAHPIGRGQSGPSAPPRQPGFLRGGPHRRSPPLASPPLAGAAAPECVRAPRTPPPPPPAARQGTLTPIPPAPADGSRALPKPAGFPSAPLSARAGAAQCRLPRPLPVRKKGRAAQHRLVVRPGVGLAPKGDHRLPTAFPSLRAHDLCPQLPFRACAREGLDPTQE